MSFDTALIGKRVGYILRQRGSFFPYIGQVRSDGSLITRHCGARCEDVEIARMSLLDEAVDASGLDRLFVDPLEVASDAAFTRVSVDQLEASELVPA